MKVVNESGKVIHEVDDHRDYSKVNNKTYFSKKLGCYELYPAKKIVKQFAILAKKINVCRGRATGYSFGTNVKQSK